MPHRTQTDEAIAGAATHEPRHNHAQEPRSWPRRAQTLAHGWSCALPMTGHPSELRYPDCSAASADVVGVATTSGNTAQSGSWPRSWTSRRWSRFGRSRTSHGGVHHGADRRAFL